MRRVGLMRFAQLLVIVPIFGAIGWATWSFVSLILQIPGLGSVGVAVIALLCAIILVFWLWSQAWQVEAFDDAWNEAAAHGQGRPEGGRPRPRPALRRRE